MNNPEFKLDYDRQFRTGITEAIFCAEKSVLQIDAILDDAVALQKPLLLTHLCDTDYAALSEVNRSHMDHDSRSRTGFFQYQPMATPTASIAIVAAGTSDTAVAREAARTLTFHGIGSALIFDVGVAGLWRLEERIDEIRRFPVVIAVAGMDAALVSVLGGLVSGAVIAVPTSTGYGAARNGETALAASLVSCSAGVVVCNIDNGFGAACAAIRILSSRGFR